MFGLSAIIRGKNDLSCIYPSNLTVPILNKIIYIFTHGFLFRSVNNYATMNSSMFLKLHADKMTCTMTLQT